MGEEAEAPRDAERNLRERSVELRARPLREGRPGSRLGKKMPRPQTASRAA